MIEELVQIFLIIKNGEIFTPFLHSGMVVGVALRFLKRNFDFLIKETNITRKMLSEADSVILCNAVKGIRVVELCDLKDC